MYIFTLTNDTLVPWDAIHIQRRAGLLRVRKLSVGFFFFVLSQTSDTDNCIVDTRSSCIHNNTISFNKDSHDNSRLLTQKSLRPPSSILSLFLPEPIRSLHSPSPRRPTLILTPSTNEIHRNAQGRTDNQCRTPLPRW